MKKNIVAQNRKARYEYHIDEVFEAGIVLLGSEVKSLRMGNGNINEAYADLFQGTIGLLNAHIPEYTKSNNFNHSPRRNRTLLLHKREANKLLGKIKMKGYTIVPLSIYFNEKNKAKVEIALARGKKLYDKREDLKKRDWEREKAGILKQENRK